MYFNPRYLALTDKKRFLYQLIYKKIQINNFHHHKETKAKSLLMVKLLVYLWFVSLQLQAKNRSRIKSGMTGKARGCFVATLLAMANRKQKPQLQ